MKRTLFIAAAALLMVIVGIAIYLYNSIDSIVESAIEKEGSRVLGTRLSVGSVNISLKSGRGTIRGVEIANPDGFSSDEMLKLGEITVDIDVKSLNRDPIVVDAITIAAPDVRVEMNEQAQSNVSVVKSAVDRYQSAAAPKGRKEDGGFAKRLVIEKFVFEKGAIDVDATAMGVEPTKLEKLGLPPVRLSNVGGSKGDTPDGVAKTISRAFMDAIVAVVTREVRARATEKAKAVATDEAHKAIDKILNREAANDSNR